jgi:radical SAM protein with 4Fe4S-binding SPASM domain
MSEGRILMDLLERVTVPHRFALIYRGGQTLGYNPNLNSWEYLADDTAEVMRWLRARRDRAQLEPHLRRRFDHLEENAGERLDEILRWCVLRHLLYLDAEPVLPELTHPQNPVQAVYWICTQACNLRCTYCYQSAAVPRPAELSTAEGMDLVRQAKALGARTFVFTGGEPFWRTDLLEIAHYCRESGLTTNVITNGHYITEDNVAEVARIFHNVTISLDHGLPHHHDRNRGEGSWAKAVNAIDLLVQAGSNVDVNTVLSHYGLSDLSELLSFAREHAVGQHRIVPQFPMGRGGGSRARTGELSESELLGVPDRLSKANKALSESQTGTTRVSAEGNYAGKMVRRNHCGAGLSEVSVDPEGWVYPCRLLQYPQFRTANVRDQALSDIVTEHPALRGIRATVASTLSPCKDCIIKYQCGGGCRGIHFSFTHEYIKAHPLFCAYLRRAFEARAWASAGISPVPRAEEFDYGDLPVDRVRTLLPIVERS